MSQKNGRDCVEADIELNGWKKLGSEWEREKKPGSVFCIWRMDEEQIEKPKNKKILFGKSRICSN